jgi:glycosyltransferase involved in cell wall biosynthesis
MANYWLFDFKSDDNWQKTWQNAFGDFKITALGTERDGKKIIFQWIDGANKALAATKSGDCIVCWFDLQGVILFFLSKLTFRKRKIIAQNIMLKLNNSFKGKLYKKGYQIALASKDFHGTVSSRYYGDYLQKELNLKEKLHLVHDPYLDLYDKNYASYSGPFEKKYDVFMGGTSSRDWNFAFRLAKELKDVSFCFILKNEQLDQLAVDVTQYPNVTLKNNVKLDEFNRDIYLSKIVMCPVTTEAPAGLIVMYTAASCNVPFMTNTNTTYMEYINDERGEILSPNIELWKERINLLLSDEKERTQKGRALHEWLLENCSLKACANALKDTIISV